VRSRPSPSRSTSSSSTGAGRPPRLRVVSPEPRPTVARRTLTDSSIRRRQGRASPLGPALLIGDPVYPHAGPRHRSSRPVARRRLLRDRSGPPSRRWPLVSSRLPSHGRRHEAGASLSTVFEQHLEMFAGATSTNVQVRRSP
jgi:hypothetical protein